MENSKIGIVGNLGSFGHFLEKTLLPATDLKINIQGIDKNSTISERNRLIRDSSDLVICVPLHIYSNVVADILPELFIKNRPTTLWLIPTIQSPTVLSINNILRSQFNNNILYIAIHPMYGPNSFTNSTFESRSSFQNIVTYVSNDVLNRKLKLFTGVLLEKLNIRTISGYTPEEHDQIIAKSQGLAYCVALEIYKNASLAKELSEKHYQLYKPFISDKKLITTFTRLNPYFGVIQNVFQSHWKRTNQLTLNELIYTFIKSDLELNGYTGAPIANQRYLYLRALRSNFE